MPIQIEYQKCAECGWFFPEPIELHHSQDECLEHQDDTAKAEEFYKKVQKEIKRIEKEYEGVTGTASEVTNETS